LAKAKKQRSGEADSATVIVVYHTTMATFKPEWQPLVDLILQKKCKKKNDIPSLCMGPPLGLLPTTVAKESANDFVKIYLPSLFAEMKKEKKKENMLHLRQRLKKIVDGAKKGADSKQEEGPKVIGYPEIDEMLAQGMSEDAILAAKGLSFVEIFAWRKAFEAFDPYRKGILEAETIAKIFEVCERECDPVDSKDIIKHFTNGASEENVTFLQFTVFLHALAKQPKERTKVFGHAFALFAKKDKAKALKADQLSEGLGAIGCEMDEDELTAFMKDAKSKKGFAKAFGAQMTRLTRAPGGKKGAHKKGKAKKVVAAVTIDPKDPKYKKYFKMRSMHLPAAAALGKAKMDGLSEGELDALAKMLK